MELKQYIAEAFSKEYGYRIKIAADCGNDHMDILEKCLAKYNFVSATPFKRTPIQENPMEFSRIKGVQFTSEVCSSDVILKYPVNERILEVWLAVNMGLDHERVLCYGVKEPRRLEAEITAERQANDVDRNVEIDPENIDKEMLKVLDPATPDVEDKSNLLQTKEVDQKHDQVIQQEVQVRQ